MEIKTEIIQASCKGLKSAGISNQDYILIDENSSFLLAAVSDGLGSSKNSLEGAKVVCKIVLNYFKNSNPNILPALFSNEITTQWEAIISKMSGEIIDYRTTNSFIIVFKNEKKIIVGRLGDVMVALRIDGIQVSISSYDKDFINETECLGSNGKLEYNIDFYDFQNSFEFLIATDGIGDELVPNKLDSLIAYLKTKYSGISRSKRNHNLKKEIEQALNNKNDDDKSLVFAWLN